ncbi:MAG: hypothetical protein ACOC0O_01185, partial [Spirochaetota bacterium]
MSTVIELPEYPIGADFEHLAFAYLACTGHYLDRNLEERAKGEQVLELDALATLFTRKECLSILVECKSGAFGFRDMFTVLGWMKYMNVSRGLLVSTEHAPPAKDAVFLKKAKDQGIDLVSCSSDAEAQSAFTTTYGESSFEPRYVSLWRYSLWLEAALLRRLKQLKKSIPSARRFKALEDYYRRINSDIFFSTNLLDRINSLFDTYRMRPNITSHAAAEMSGGDFTADAGRIPEELFRQTFFECANSELQTSLYIEHRARIAIMRNAIEYRILTDAGVDDERTTSAYTFLGVP